MVSAMESSGFDNYMAQEEAGPAMARDERAHSRTLSTMYSPGGGTDVAGIARGERWHRVDTGGQLRAAIFGISDGLHLEPEPRHRRRRRQPGRQLHRARRRRRACSPARSRWARASSSPSRRSASCSSARSRSRRKSWRLNPEEERRELALIYRAKGLPQDEADALSSRIIADRGVALETLAREELGLNPEGLGSPYGVAHRVVPRRSRPARSSRVIPWFFGSTRAFFVASVVLSGIALFAVGAGVSLFTGRNFIFAGLRQLAHRRPPPRP